MHISALLIFYYSKFWQKNAKFLLTKCKVLHILKTMNKPLKMGDLVKPNLSEIARRLGKSRTWISLVWNRHFRGEKTRKEIAELLGIPYEELWGEPPLEDREK